jgi:ribosomal protein S3
MLLTYIKRLFRSKEEILREKKDVCYFINRFFTIKNNYDYIKTEKYFDDLRITNIEIAYHRIFIKLGRPGLLIGHKGVLISQLEAYLFAELKRPIKIEVIEDEFVSLLYYAS